VGGDALTQKRRLAWERSRSTCRVCEGPIFQRYEGGPWLHVNLDDWAHNPHEARPFDEDQTEGHG
jgi:hypothetical protein